MSIFNSNKKDMSRRKFIGDCGKMTSIGAMASAINLKMMNKVMAARSPGSINDYKGLVCVFLFGGNDSFNMLYPSSNSGFAEYTSVRGRQALDPGLLLNDRIGNPDFYLHRSMPGVANMFAQNDLAFVSNIGTLVEPLTRAEFNQQDGKARPFGLFSHNDQQRQWQTSLPATRSGPLASQGWVGRMTDILTDAANNNATLNVALAPGGNNILQAGRTNSPFTVVGGADEFSLYENNGNIRRAFDRTTESVEETYSHVLEQHYNSVRASAVEQNNELVNIENNTPLNTQFPNTGLGRQLEQVAQYIARHEQLGANRQNFFVSRGGWDLHSGATLDIHSSLLAELSAALTAFNAAMKELGEHDNVVTYTASDFGRTLSSNGRGSDHGWGGNQLLMGGPVGGGRVFGDYPSLANNAPTNLGRGRILPTTSVDQMHATIARWYGITNSEMPMILPNVGNFPNNGFIRGLI